MKKRLMGLLIITLALSAVFSVALPVKADDFPLPPLSPAESWHPPYAVTQVLEPPVNVEAYDQLGLNLQMSSPMAIVPGVPSSIVNTYLVNSYGQVLTSLYRNQICYLIVSLNSPGYFYLWEYYPTGTSPHGHWLCYRWYRPHAGVWRIGPFAAQSFDPAGRYYWKMWFLSGSSWTTRSLSYDYSGSYYPPDMPGLAPEPVSPPVINSFSPNKSSIDKGETAILTWTTTNANSVTISPEVGSVAASGSTTVTPTATTIYTIMVKGKLGNSASSTVTITVMPRIPPTITIGQATIQKGKSTTLSWNAHGAVGVWITDVGNASSSGTTQVSPREMTMYTLTATYVDGTTQSVSATLNVEQPPYLLWGVIAFLVIAAIIMVALLIRRPVKARRAQGADTQGGHITSNDETLSTDTLPVTTPVVDAFPAALTMPDGHEILLAGNARSFGRKDFEEFIPQENVSYISRQHINIWYDIDQYYIEDRSSTNGTRINGVDIKGNGRHVLADGDEIELAGKLTITFKIQNIDKEVE
jgi:hypothetical protein